MSGMEEVGGEKKTQNNRKRENLSARLQAGVNGGVVRAPGGRQW